MQELAGIVVAVLVSVSVVAQEAKPGAESAADALAKQLSNPIPTSSASRCN